MSSQPAIDTPRPLKNAQHEAFAQKVSTGMPVTEAYQKVFGSKQASAKTCGSRLLSKVSERVAAIQSGQKLKATHLTIEEKRDLYANIVRTPISEVDEHSILCQSFKRTITESGSMVTEYKMIDKLAAIKMDDALSGHVVQAAAQINIQNNATFNVVVMSEPRRRALMDKKRAAIEKRLALPLKSANPQPDIET